MTFDFICNIVKARLLLFSPGDGSFFSQQGISRIGEMLNLVAQCLSVCHIAISKKKAPTAQRFEATGLFGLRKTLGNLQNS